MPASDPPLKFGSFSIASCRPFAGVVLGDERVLAVEALRAACRRLDLPLSPGDTLFDLLQDWDRNLASVRAALAQGVDEALCAPLEGLRRHAPVAAPRQVICTGANYRKHVIDLMVAQGGGAATEGMGVEERRRQAEVMMDERAAHGRPYAWVKTATAVAGPEDDLVLPAHVKEPDWELELAVVIGKGGRHIPRTDAFAHVAGYMVANDVTARDWVFRHDMKVLGTDWITGKGAPGFLPTGPFLVPRDAVRDPADLRITLKLNGEVMQDESTSDMIFDISRQI